MNITVIALLIIIITSFISWKGLQNRIFLDKYMFDVEKVLLYKQYYRIITSGFVHLTWLHLIFNMVALYLFSNGLSYILSIPEFIIIYFTALTGGNMFALLIHKKDRDYTSAGASGAIYGIIFSSIALSPGMSIGLFLLPISIPGWLFGLCIVLFSVYGIQSRRDNVGHESHLGGALFGLCVAIMLHPSALLYNYFAVLIIAIPSAVFIYIIITRPHLLLVDNYFYKKYYRNYSIDQRYNIDKKNQQQEIDRILEKIHKKGMNSLSKKEKLLLDEYAKTVK
jgi:membrane associated rhomboid family serine protease